jgi:hypothetical protein
VQPPPPDYDFRAQIQGSTEAIVSSRYPQLMDLVQEGGRAARCWCTAACSAAALRARPAAPAAPSAAPPPPRRRLPRAPAGTLVVYQRPADYRERRSDGYCEPAELFVVGTGHLSAKSAEDVARVVQVRAPAGPAGLATRARAGGAGWHLGAAAGCGGLRRPPADGPAAGVLLACC